MKIDFSFVKSAKFIWFAAYTAVFAVVAGYVFWGTWSSDFSPVMPDCPICYSPWWFSDWWRSWLTNGKFTPDCLRIFFGTPWFWQELNYVIPLWSCGLAIAYFLRGRGLPRAACYGAGLLLAFCGYWMTLFSAGHAGWFWWMLYGPWAFGLIDRAVRKGKLKNWLLSGAVVGWACYWQPDLWLLFTIFTAAFFVFCEIENRHAFRFPRSLIGPGLASVAFLIVASAGIRNAFVNDLAGREAQIESGETVAGADSIDAKEKRWIFVTNWSLPFNETREFWNARVNGDTSCPFTLTLSRRSGKDIKPYTGALGRPKDAPTGNYRQHSLYVGWITCLLALCGLVLNWKKPVVLFFGSCAILFYLCSLGRYCEPVYSVIYSLPFGDTLRAPVKWHHLTEFCLVILAGFGLASIGRFCNARTAWVVPAVVLLGVADLARIDRLYCAPVDLRSAKRYQANLSMTYLPRTQLEHPEVRRMLQSGQLVLLGSINQNVEAVGVLDPFKRNREPMPPFGTAAWLGLLSILSSVAVVSVAVGIKGPSSRI